MANEAVPIEGPYEAHDFTVQETVAIDKYTLCMLSGANLAFASAGAEVFAGVAGTDKVATDNATTLGLNTTGTYDLKTLGPAIPAGTIVALSGANLIKAADATDLLTGAAFGKAMEDIGVDGTGMIKIGSME